MALVFVGVLVGWFAMLPLMLQIPYIGDLLWWVVLLPAMMAVAVIALHLLARFRRSS
jgi:hypothetical protein